MSATTHHEIHPDAEMLSAFAEQALSATERTEVLEHLAICGRCREVVALARDAEGAEVASARPEVLQPRAWWRSWGLVMAPAAAVVATALIAIYVHERGVERVAEVAKLERLRAGERSAMPSQATPHPPMPAAAPTPPRSAPEKTIKTDRPERASRPEMAEPAPATEPNETAAVPPPDALAPAGSASDDTIQTEAAYDEQRKKQSEEAQERRQFAAKAPMPGSGAPRSSGGGTTEPADVSAQQLETQPAREAGLLQFHRQLRSMMDVPANPYALRLPSGRLAVSFTSADHRTLAVDEKGTLFLREDSGGPWERVERQWAGRVVAVRSRTNATAPTGVTPVPETEENPAPAGALSQPNTVFELVNDQSQVWISADGRIWTEK